MTRPRKAVEAKLRANKAGVRVAESPGELFNTSSCITPTTFWSVTVNCTNSISDGRTHR
jgi:hypothetical protein